MATFPLWLRNQMLDLHQARVAARIALEVGVDVPNANGQHARAPGDPRKLRGVPVVGVPGGMGGAIAGTRPGDTVKNS